jgi:hypothetical protein
MATSIKLKKSSVPGRAPAANDLEYGELAINYADGTIYYKNTSNTVQSISATPNGVDSAAVTNLIDTDYIQQRANAGAGSLDFGTFAVAAGFSLDLGAI